MFHLVNQFGNVHKHVQSEAKKNAMLKDGWKLVEDNDAAIAATPHPSPAATPSPQGEGLNDDAPYEDPQQDPGAQEIDGLNDNAAEDDTATADNDGDNAAEDDTAAVATTVAEEQPKAQREPKAAKSPKSTTGKSTKGAAKKKKTEE